MKTRDLWQKIRVIIKSPLEYSFKKKCSNLRKGKEKLGKIIDPRDLWGNKQNFYVL